MFAAVVKLGSVLLGTGNGSNVEQPPSDTRLVLLAPLNYELIVFLAESSEMRVSTITVPDLAPGVCAFGADSLFEAVRQSEVADSYQLDLQSRSMIAPHGVLAIMLSARLLHQKSGRPVELINMEGGVYPYFRRVNLFERGEKWLYTDQPLDEEWSRIPQSPNLLDITFIRSGDIIEIVKHAETIFERWLSEDDLPRLGNIISELCENISRHSRDNWGCLMIQKYELPSKGYVKVCLAFADMGVGIRGSLSTCYPNLPTETIGCLTAAVAGVSSRGIGAAGQGLGTASDTARRSGGHLILRSHNAAFWLRSNDTMEKPDLAYIPGTQISVEFRAPLSKAA